MRFDVTFAEKAHFNIGFNDSTKDLNAGFGVVHLVNNIGQDDVYGGPCDVTPSVDAQTLETKDKFMPDDVRIKAIPYFEVSNAAGGTTVYIGTMEE